MSDDEKWEVIEEVRKNSKLSHSLKVKSDVMTWLSMGFAYLGID